MIAASRWNGGIWTDQYLPCPALSLSRARPPMRGSASAVQHTAHAAGSPSPRAHPAPGSAHPARHEFTLPPRHRRFTQSYQSTGIAPVFSNSPGRTQRTRRATSRKTSPEPRRLVHQRSLRGSRSFCCRVAVYAKRPSHARKQNFTLRNPSTPVHKVKVQRGVRPRQGREREGP